MDMNNITVTYIYVQIGTSLSFKMYTRFLFQSENYKLGQFYKHSPPQGPRGSSSLLGEAYSGWLMDTTLATLSTATSRDQRVRAKHQNIRIFYCGEFVC